MNFSELKTRVIEDAFPIGGAPENLVTSVERYVESALIEIQRWVPCFAYRHDDVYAACQTYWHCGASVITAPRGRILRAYTIDNEAWCRPVVLTPVDIGELRRWQAKWRSNWASAYYNPPNSGAGLPMGFDVPSTSSDAVSGRALTGLYALEPTAKRLWVAPWIQTTESLVVEWQGIKRTWNAGDLVPSDPDFIRLVRLFVELEYGRKWQTEDLVTRERAWAEALADAKVTCVEETRLHGKPATAEEVDLAAWSNYVSDVVEAETPSDATNITFVGDVGTADANAEAVAEAIAADNPDGQIILVGDCKYAPNNALAALAPYETPIAEGRVKAALGNHDVDDGHLGADVRTLVGNPGNGRYFTVTSGPVSVFVIHSGLNTSGQMVEPDGNYDGSVQQQAIIAAILRDTSPWKIAVLHHPPYTSSSAKYPGTSDVRWVSRLPVHAVIAGHAHQYERLVIGGKLYLTAGTGGMTLYGFRGDPYPGSLVRISSFGFVRMTATCDEASLDFVDVDGVVQDTVELLPDINQPYPG